MLGFGPGLDRASGRKWASLVRETLRTARFRATAGSLSNSYDDPVPGPPRGG